MKIPGVSRSRLNVASALLIWGSALVGPHGTSQDTFHGTGTSPLIVAGDVRAPLSLTLTELRAMPRASVHVKGEGGRIVKYEGVLVGELLARAGATVGGEMRGTALTTCVLASAGDGYRALFSLAELGPAFTRSETIVADTIDRRPLATGQGPFRIVSPGDARPARSVRMLQRLDVVRIEK